MAVRCQVCTLELPPMHHEDAGAVHWLIDLLHEPNTMRGHRLCLEPWVCDDCLVYALQVCPGMLRARKKKSNALRSVLAVTTANIVAVTIKPGGNLTGRPPCVGYLKIEPLCYVRIAAEHLLSYGPAEIRFLLGEDGKP